MKKLFLIRHAKSSWADMNLDDFERPLNKRGKHDAPMMGKRLHKRGIKADLILSSSAKRAKKTAKKIAKEIGYSPFEIQFLETLYESNSRSMLEIIKQQNKSIDTLFMVGHNPELNTFAYKLVGFDENIVTCGIVEIGFRCEDWKDISAHNATMISYDFPKNGV